ncbi:hypothetical protein [Blattabacterium cuenoti]|uniref:hypothetical protein n=1 Tax=Blattabacterium cuenoti TaxID=1653831 RepID=UPI00163CB376|nr:hypothetical protein [Blattabacterium cuenoti]
MDYKNIFFIFTFMFFSFNTSCIPFFGKKKTIEIGEFTEKISFLEKSFAFDIKKYLEECVKKYSSLEMVPKNGDILIKGVFLDYFMSTIGNTPIQKIQLIVRINYKDRLEPKKSWKKYFSSSEYFLYRNYEDNIFLNEPAIDQVTRDLTIKIFNKISYYSEK